MQKAVWLTAGTMIAALTLAIVLSSPQPTQAGLSAPAPTNPPPTWTPGPPVEKTTMPAHTEVAVRSKVDAPGVITIQVLCTIEAPSCTERLPKLWTQVEAQNLDGSWAPVPGWAGNLTQIEETQGQRSWWFGTQAPARLRWVVSEGVEGELLIISNAFQPAPSTPSMVVVSMPSTPVLLPVSGHAAAIVLSVLISLILICLAVISGMRNSPTQ